MPILIDCDKLLFLKAADSVKQLEYWAEILCPDSDFLIADTEKRIYSAFTEMELKVLYGNTIMQDLRHIVPASYNKLLNEVVKLGETLELDPTPVSDLETKLGRPLGKPDPRPIKEKPGKKAPTKSSGKTSSSGPAKRPKPGSATGKVWDIADKVLESSGYGPYDKALRNLVVAECVKEGINSSTAATQFGKWKGSK